MQLATLRRWLTLFSLASLGWLAAGSAWAQCNSCGRSTTGCSVSFCQTHHCAPPLRHCQEGPPRIHGSHGCPRPICDPCTMPNWGYSDTCWQPWPFPPDWSHCPTVPPAALVFLNPNAGQQMPLTQPPATFQTPRVANPGALPRTNPMPTSDESLRQPRNLSIPQ